MSRQSSKESTGSAMSRRSSLGSNAEATVSAMSLSRRHSTGANADVQAMNPIAAYKARQERLMDTSLNFQGSQVATAKPDAEKCIAELRLMNLRWTTIFDGLSSKGKTLKTDDAVLKYEDACEAFSQVVGANQTYPVRQCAQYFKAADDDGVGQLDFRQFYKFVKSLLQFMQENGELRPSQDQEAEADRKEREQKQRAKQEFERKNGDMFEILGIKKSKDVQDAEARKQNMMTRSNSTGSSFKRAGSMVVASGAMKRDSSLTTVRPSSRSSGIGDIGNLDSGFGRQESNESNCSGIGELPTLTKGKVVVRRGLQSKSVKRAVTLQCTGDALPAAHGLADPSPTTALRNNWSSPDTEGRARMDSSSGSPHYSGGSNMLLRRHTIDVLDETCLFHKQLCAPKAACLSLKFSEDGTMVAGGFFDGRLRIYATDKCELVRCLNLSGEEVRTKKPLAKGAVPSKASLNDSDDEQFKPLDIVKDLSDPAITCVRWRPGGSKVPCLATGDTAGNLAVWKAPDEASYSRCEIELKAQILGTQSLDALCWTMDGSKVLVGGAERVIRAYSLDELSAGTTKLTAVGSLGEGVAMPGRMSGHALKIVSLCAHPTNPNIVVSGGIDCKVLIWDMRDRSPVGSVRGTDLSGDAIGISGDGTRLLTGSHRSKCPIQVHELRKLTEENPVASYPGEVKKQPSVNRNNIGECASLRSAYEWRGNEAPFSCGARPTNCLLFSAAWDALESKTIVACGEKENLARVYEMQADPDEPLKVVGTFYGQEHAFLASAISADGRNAAFGSADGGILLVDVK